MNLFIKFLMGWFFVIPLGFIGFMAFHIYGGLRYGWHLGYKFEGWYLGKLTDEEGNLK